MSCPGNKINWASLPLSWFPRTCSELQAGQHPGGLGPDVKDPSTWLLWLEYRLLYIDLPATSHCFILFQSQIPVQPPLKDDDDSGALASMGQAMWGCKDSLGGRNTGSPASSECLQQPTPIPDLPPCSLHSG